VELENECRKNGFQFIDITENIREAVNSSKGMDSNKLMREVDALAPRR
jgi:hypothetical protein